MRIGLLAPPVEPVPPNAYGGTERVVAILADALVGRGHDVTLFASGDSRTRARLVPVVEKAIWHDPRFTDPLPFWTLTIARAYARAGELDLMHSHADHFAYPAARLAAVPTVSTVHGRLDLPELAAMYAEFAEQPLVSVSLAQRRPLPGAHWVGNVHHGLPASLYRPAYARGSYLAWCGRFSREKGIDRAVEIARRAGLPLKVGARRPRPDRVEDGLREEWAYWEAVVRPLMAEPFVEYVGELDEAGKQDLYGGALALLAPIDWPEPFGLVMIEALACGTPVLARPRGSVREIVRDGATGLYCETVDDFVDGVARAEALDRRACRAEFERRFTDDVMAADYERVYARVASPATPVAEAPAGSEPAMLRRVATAAR